MILVWLRSVRSRVGLGSVAHFSASAPAVARPLLRALSLIPSLPSVLGWFGPVVGLGRPGGAGCGCHSFALRGSRRLAARHPATTRPLIENCGPDRCVGIGRRGRLRQSWQVPGGETFWPHRDQRHRDPATATVRSRPRTAPTSTRVAPHGRGPRRNAGKTARRSPPPPCPVPRPPPARAPDPQARPPPIATAPARRPTTTAAPPARTAGTPPPPGQPPPAGRRCHRRSDVGRGPRSRPRSPPAHAADPSSAPSPLTRPNPRPHPDQATIKRSRPACTVCRRHETDRNHPFPGDTPQQRPRADP